MCELLHRVRNSTTLIAHYIGDVFYITFSESYIRTLFCPFLAVNVLFCPGKWFQHYVFQISHSLHPQGIGGKNENRVSLWHMCNLKPRQHRDDKSNWYMRKSGEHAWMEFGEKGAFCITEEGNKEYSGRYMKRNPRDKKKTKAPIFVRYFSLQSLGASDGISDIHQRGSFYIGGGFDNRPLPVACGQLVIWCNMQKIHWKHFYYKIFLEYSANLELGKYKT